MDLKNPSVSLKASDDGSKVNETTVESKSEVLMTFSMGGTIFQKEQEQQKQQQGQGHVVMQVLDSKQRMDHLLNGSKVKDHFPDTDFLFEGIL